MIAIRLVLLAVLLVISTFIDGAVLSMSYTFVMSMLIFSMFKPKKQEKPNA